MAKTKSSRRWLDRHFNDPYVLRAQREGFRSRAAFKLLEIQEKDHILRPGQVVVDLGAAPGGWTQVASRLVGERGTVVAMDILPMDPMAGATLLQGDFREEKVLQSLREMLGGRTVDLVISDMAPNVTGVAAVDLPRSMHLCELALEFGREVLRPGGDFLVKVFQGEGFQEYLKSLRDAFDKVLTRKPEASRAHSREVYLLARGKRN